MKNREIYNDYQNVYKAMSGDKSALASIERNYGKINNMGDLYKLGTKLFDLLNEDEKDMDIAQTELSLRPFDETKKHRGN
jgi:hypothetical protein